MSAPATALACVEPGDPRAPEAVALLTASHAYLASLYAPEDNHYLSIDALCVPDIDFFIARTDGTATGCAALKDCGAYGEVKSMFVAPHARGDGTGARLMEAIESAARARGLTVLRLETGDTLAPAHRLYARHGYGPCGPFGDYVAGPHSVFMEKQLAPVAAPLT